MKISYPQISDTIEYSHPIEHIAQRVNALMPDNVSTIWHRANEVAFLMSSKSFGKDTEDVDGLIEIICLFLLCLGILSICASVTYYASAYRETRRRQLQARRAQPQATREMSRARVRRTMVQRQPGGHQVANSSHQDRAMNGIPLQNIQAAHTRSERGGVRNWGQPSNVSRPTDPSYNNNHMQIGGPGTMLGSLLCLNSSSPSNGDLVSLPARGSTTTPEGIPGADTILGILRHAMLTGGHEGEEF